MCLVRILVRPESEKSSGLSNTINRFSKGACASSIAKIAALSEFPSVAS